MASYASHRRRSIRLSSYDYAQPGAYFVTLCTRDRASLFGSVVDNVMCLNNYGQIAQTCWRAIPQHFPLVWLDIFVIMPNHLHAIVQIIGYAQYQGGALPRGADLSGSVGDVSTLRRLSNGTAAGSLSAIIQNFKSVTARKINQVKQGTSIGIWQRNYYERVIRNENELKAIRQYIEDNPLKWALDRENFVP